MSRTASMGREPLPVAPLELYEITEAPMYDDDRAEWKVVAVPVRANWGFVSGGGEWVGGGHRTDGMSKLRWRREDDDWENDLWLPDWWRDPLKQEAFKAPPPVWVGERLYAANIDGYLHLQGSYKDREVGFVLKEAHQGRGNETDVYCGIWNIADQEWEYGCTPVKAMIHWRFGTPEPAAGATGLGVWRESTDNGAILEVVVGDCDSVPVACS